MLFRRTKISRLVALLLSVTSLALTQTKAQTSNVVVRVMAANLTSDSQKYEAKQIQLFKGLKPDVVAIQEFNYDTSSPGQIRAFVDTAFAPSFYYFRESGGLQIPNGIISRYPILNSGSWTDPEVSNRGFAWAQIDLPGTNDLYVVSVHFLTSGDRAAEAAALKGFIQTSFPTNAWIIVAGDFNAGSRTETALNTLTTFLSDSPIPTDAVSGGNPNTNKGREEEYDYVLPSFSLTNRLTNVVFASHSFPKGLVFDSRVYDPLSDVFPIVFGDSADSQHMPVIKDFLIPVQGTNTPSAPAITTEPQSQTNQVGANVTFTVSATGTAPLTYQWRFQGTNLFGATTNSYTVLNAQSTNAGNYTVVITNSVGSVTSAVAALTITATPFITTQPQSTNVNVGGNATFTVLAGGESPLSYQWRRASTNIAGATVSTYTRSNAQPADAGSYTVVVTNAAGSITSSVATLTVSSTSGSVIALWNFNSAPSDGNTGTGTLSPAIGTGTAAYIGGTAAAGSGEYAGGSATDTNATDNTGWNTSTYPAATVGNKTAGVRFNVSTLGRQNISIRWDQRQSGSGSRYMRLQYTTNGTDFVDYSTPITNATTNFEPKTNNLAAIPLVNNNASFAFRIVAEFESSAIGSANGNYVGATSGYGTSGTVRFDLLTITGDPIPAPNPPPAPAVLSTPLVQPGQFQFLLTGSTGSNYIVQATTNVAVSNWLSLQTNTAPFTFTDTNAPGFPQRFYRALAPQ